MGQRKTDRELLDEAVAQQQAGTYVDPLAGAKAFLSRPTVSNQTSREVGDKAAAQEQGRLDGENNLLSGIKNRWSEDPLSAAANVAIPASFLGGPVGMAAGGVLSVDALRGFAEEPSVGNAAAAGLGLLPFVKPARRLAGLAREEKAIKGVKATYGAGDMGAAFKREVPYKRNYDTRPAYEPSNFRKAMDGPTPEMSVVEPDAGVPQSKGTMSEVDSFLESLGLGQKRAQARGQTAEEFKRLGSFDPHQSPQNFAAPGLTATEHMPEFSPEALAAEEALGPIRMRPEASHVHAADSSGGAFGFDDLPEISEGELSRMQDLFRRVTGR